MIVATPPRWADALLRMLLEPRDRETVSGDLLEEYREAVVPTRGRAAADLWYVQQVVGFAWRGQRVWAALFSGSFLVRTALDWLRPTADFSGRASVSTMIGIGILASAGVWAARRTGSIRAGALAGGTTVLFASVTSVVGAACLLAFRHDAATLEAIRASGGLAEVFTLPLMLLPMGVLVGALGGVAGRFSRR